MPANRSVFQIEFTSKADVSGAEKMAAATKSNVSALDEFRAALDGAKAAAKEEAEQHAKNIPQVEKLTLSHRELRESVGAVGRAFGGLPDVGLWINPQLAAIPAMLEAYEKLNGMIDETITRYVKLLDASRELKERFEDALPKAAEESRGALEKFRQEVFNAARAIDTLGEAEKNAEARAKDALANTNSQADAEERRAQALIKIEEQLGKINSEQADLLSLNAKYQAQKEKDAADDAAADAEVARKHALVTGYGTEVKSAQATVAKQSGNLERTNAAIDTWKGTVTDTQQALEDAKKEFTAHESAYAKAKGEAFATQNVPVLGAASAANEEVMRGRFEASKEALDQARKKAAQEHESALERQKAAIEADIASANDLIKSRGALIRATTEAVNEMEAKNKADREAREKHEKTDREADLFSAIGKNPTAAAEFGRVSGMSGTSMAAAINERAKAASDLFRLVKEPGHIITPDEAQRIFDMLDTLHGDIGAWIAAGHSESSRMSELERKYSELSSYLNTNRNSPQF
jgi:DNA repair exonuclease SbcCD ATPase subunit